MSGDVSTDPTESLVDTALEALRAGASFADAYAQVLARAAEQVPSPAWEALGAVDVATDVERATGWLVRQLEERWPPPELSGLRFGLYPVRGPRPGRTELVLAVSGGARFPEAGWEADQPWDPVGYAPTPGLRSLLPLAAEERDEVRAVVGGAVALVYAVGLVVAAIDGADASRVLGNRPHLGVAAGFPDGDLVLVGVVTPAGLDRSSMDRMVRPEPHPSTPPPS